MSLQANVPLFTPWKHQETSGFTPWKHQEISGFTPWKHQETSGFLMFLGGKKRNSVLKWVEVNNEAISKNVC